MKEYPENLELMKELSELLDERANISNPIFWKYMEKDAITHRRAHIHLCKAYNGQIDSIMIQFEGSPPRSPIYVEGIGYHPHQSYIRIEGRELRSEFKKEKCYSAIKQWLIKNEKATADEFTK